MTPPKPPSCDSCEFNSKIDDRVTTDGGFHYCRRYPENIHKEFLLILTNDWCGEHKPREEDSNE